MANNKEHHGNHELPLLQTVSLLTAKEQFKPMEIQTDMRETQTTL